MKMSWEVVAVNSTSDSATFKFSAGGKEMSWGAPVLGRTPEQLVSDIVANHQVENASHTPQAYLFRMIAGDDHLRDWVGLKGEVEA